MNSVKEETLKKDRKKKSQERGKGEEGEGELIMMKPPGRSSGWGGTLPLRLVCVGGGAGIIFAEITKRGNGSRKMVFGWFPSKTKNPIFQGGEGFNPQQKEQGLQRKKKKPPRGEQV